MSHKTKISAEFIFTWTIKNYSSCYRRVTECISSPQFLADNLSGYKWQLELNPKGEVPDFDYVSCYINQESDHPTFPDANFKYKISLSSKSNKVLACKDDKDLDYPGWQRLIKIDQLKNEMKNWTEDTLIINFYIKCNEIKRATGCSGSTNVNVDRCSFLWVMEKPRDSNWTYCKTISLSSTSDIMITFISPKDDILINICNINGHSKERKFVKCKISLLDVKGVEKDSRKASYVFESDNSNESFPSFFSKSRLHSETFTFVVKNNFTVLCELSVSDGSHFEDINYKYDTIPRGDPLQTLQEDLRSIFISKKFCDVKLRIGNKTFPAHKPILSARSSVFGTMFIIANESGIVDISNLDSVTLMSFLEFIYTGSVDYLDYKTASNLLVAAKEYDVFSLQEICGNFLISVLSDENVCEIIVLANCIKCELLKQKALNYIVGHAESVLHSTQWSEFKANNVELANETLEFAFLNAIKKNTPGT